MRSAFFTVGIGLIATAVAAQPAPSASDDAPALKLEVASIRRDLSNDPGPRFAPYGDGARITGITVQLMISIAYSVQSFQIAGGADWIRNDRYDVIATLRGADGKPTRGRLPDIFRAVLTERFGLQFHRESREGSTFALVVANGGSKLVPAAGLRPMMASAATGYLSGTMELTTLCNWLSWRLERPVANRTGIAGAFDIELIWTADADQASGTRLPAPAPPPPPPPSAATGPILPMRQPPPNASGPPLFTAVQEQLGLRLESVRGPVGMLVIDGIDRPAVD